MQTIVKDRSIREKVLVEPHAFGSFVPSGSKVLVIGTFPTHLRNRDFDFFYPNSNNVFWKIIGTIYGYSFTNTKGNKAVNERKELMKKHKIAMTDMLAEAIRKDQSSSDDNLIPVKLMNITNILKKCPTIQRIVLTSRSKEVCALNLFIKHLNGKSISLYTVKEGRMVKGHFEFLEKRIEVFIPYSPAPRVVRRFGFDLLKDMYKQSLIIDLS